MGRKDPGRKVKFLVNSVGFEKMAMLAVAVLAAGKGTRIKSDLPKVLLQIGGKSLLERVLNSSKLLKPDKSLVIVGHESDLVIKNSCHIENLQFVIQNPQNGTGHAVMQLEKHLREFEGDLLLLNGDVPLLEPKTLENLVNEHQSQNSEATLLTARMEDPKGYGRVFVDDKNNIESIIEDVDCTNKEKENNLVNSGIYCFKWKSLINVLPNLNSNNNQGELYITDTIKMLTNTKSLEIDDINELRGVNNRKQLAECEVFLQEKIRTHWMNEGVTFIDPSSCTLSEDCEIERDVVIEPQTHIKGKSKIGKGSHIGPGSVLEDCLIGENVKILMSVVKESRIENNTTVGPYSHIRPGCNLGKESRIGNFVEIKKSDIGNGSKVNHLSYIGDAQLGKKVNIGAGTITANFDGRYKHKTVIGDLTKTGANSVLVAPICLGSNVTVGAGSTLTKDAGDNTLTLSRSKQITKDNWLR